MMLKYVVNMISPALGIILRMIIGTVAIRSFKMSMVRRCLHSQKTIDDYPPYGGENQAEKRQLGKSLSLLSQANSG